MSIKRFTEEELSILRGNPYTLKATPSSISFTPEFKEHLWIEINGGVPAKEIIKDCGYDPEMLGAFRIKGLLQHLRENKRKDDSTVADKSQGDAGVQPDRPSTEDELRQLKKELRYLRKEVDFLKKISSLRTSGKQATS